jgi:tRNA threonylcarbamoyladenosine biosynthesis protein TsaB
MNEQGWNARRLDAVFVGRGPGSYTGLRVGIMSAKTLAYATGCVLLGIDTFAVIAHQAPPEAQHVDVLADAQQSKVYLQSFHRTDTGWQAASKLRIVPVADWQAWREADSWIGGPGSVRYASHFADNIPRLAEPDPGPESLLKLGLERYFAGDRDDPYALEPLYLRPSAAEEQRQKCDQLPAG